MADRRQSRKQVPSNAKPPKSWLLDLPADIFPHIFECLHSRDLARVSRTCRLFRNQAVLSLYDFVYRDEPNMDERTTNPFSPPSALPVNLIRFKGQFPRTRSSSFVTSEFKFMLNLLRQSCQVKSIRIDFPFHLQVPYSVECLEFDWIGAIRTLVSSCSSSLTELYLRKIPCIHGGADLEKIESLIEFCSLSLPNLEVFELTATGAELKLFSKLSDERRLAFGTNTALSFSKMTKLVRLHFIYPFESSLGPPESLRCLSSLTRLESLSLLNYGPMMFQSNTFERYIEQGIPLFNAYEPRYGRTSLLSWDNPQHIPTLFDYFGEKGRNLGSEVWNFLFSRELTRDQLNLVLNHPWAGPQVQKYLSSTEPPENVTTRLPNDESVFQILLDMIMQATHRSGPDKALFLPKHTVNTLFRLLEYAIPCRNLFSKHVKSILFAAPQMPLLRPALLRLTFIAGHIPTILRCLNTKFVHPGALKIILNDKTQEFDGPGLCFEMFTKKPFYCTEKEYISVVQALLAAGCPTHPLKLDDLDPQIIKFIVTSPQFQTLPEHGTAAVFRALVKVNADTDLLVKFAQYFSRQQMVHLIGGHPQRLQVLAAARQ